MKLGQKRVHKKRDSSLMSKGGGAPTCCGAAGEGDAASCPLWVGDPKRAIEATVKCESTKLGEKEKVDTGTLVWGGRVQGEDGCGKRDVTWGLGGGITEKKQTPRTQAELGKDRRGGRVDKRPIMHPCLVK